jgi:oxygen-independent coproporphyrinogen III oxidase
MAGIYIHIPFCRQKCSYCDFYKTVHNNLHKEFIAALKIEATRRKNYLEGELVDTIYFGGGTPSVLMESEFNDILSYLKQEYPVSPHSEITFEANPDDLEISFLQALYNAGFNRLSIGIQSFQDEHLRKMKRRHNVRQAFMSVENAVKAGFKHISADLIYGLPGLTYRQWQQSLKDIFSLPVDHLSAYHLTYHEGTPFYNWLKEGTLTELPENESVRQFYLLIDKAYEVGFEHYEISNFAKNQKYSKHNMAYWTGKKYIGLGPSSHSFNGLSRRWNVNCLETYIKAIENDTSFYQQEELSENEQFNEYILTRLRTKWGVSFQTITEQFGTEKGEFFLKESEKFLQNHKIIQDNGIFFLSREGLIISDEIMASFMII